MKARMICSSSSHMGEAYAYALSLPTGREALHVMFETEVTHSPDQHLWGEAVEFVAGVLPAADWQPRGLSAKFGGDVGENEEELLALTPEEAEFLRKQDIATSEEKGRERAEKIFRHDD